MKKDKIMEMDFRDDPSVYPMKRRDFLKIFGGGIIISCSISGLLASAKEISKRDDEPKDYNAFLKIFFMHLFPNILSTHKIPNSILPVIPENIYFLIN